VRDALAPVPEPPEVVSRDAADAMARARATKRTADVARAVLDRWRYETAPSPFDEDRPLVTVRIPTWNGRRLLVERALPSVLAGEYRDLEILVCSDGPDPEARAAVEEIAARDPRVRYFELPERPVYPAAKLNLHRVGGIAAMNAANRAARGAFICPLDHDDAFTVHHVSGLLHAAREARADFVYGQALCEIDGGWAVNGFPHFGEGLVSHGAVMWSSRLRHVLHDPDAWILDEAGDWNTWRRMLAAGATPAFLQSPVLLHFAERSSIGGIEPPEPTPEEQLADLHATGAGWLLRVAGVYGP